MNNLTYTQRALLRRRGIEVVIEYANGTAKCITSQGFRHYTIVDLKRIAQPGPVQRIKNWIAGVAA